MRSHDRPRLVRGVIDQCITIDQPSEQTVLSTPPFLLFAVKHVWKISIIRTEANTPLATLLHVESY